MDHSRHHDYIGSNDERSRTSVNAYYSREIPEITSQHHYYAPSTVQQPAPPVRNLGNARKLPCDCTTTPSGASITCNGCRLNPPPDDVWPSMAASSSSPANEHQQPQHIPRGGGVGEYRQMVANEHAMRPSIRQSPMYMQQQQPQQQPPPLPPSQQQQQQHLHPQHPQQHQHQHPQPPPPTHMVQHGPSPSSQAMMQLHPSQVGNRTSNYWPQSPSANSQHYGNDHHMSGPPQSSVSQQPTTQTQIDISITRRSSMPTGASMDGSGGGGGGGGGGGMYGQYKSASITATASHPSHASSSYPPQSSSTSTSNLLHQRGVSAIGGPAVPTSVTQGSSHYVTKERIYEHTKYSSTTTTTKIAYNSTTSSSAVYESQHHPMNNNSLIGSKSSLPPIDHHVINPSNLPASKEQHPSPNYARKCPQMYTPEAEQSTAHHHHLYMPTPQFSSEKFARASPQQAPDFSKLRESPLQQPSSATGGSPYMGEKYNHVTPPSHLRESPSQFVQQSSVSRNSSSYFNSSQNHPSKVHPPEMSPIIMKQSHAHYQYSTKNPLQPPPQMPPSVATHQMHHHQIPPGAKANAPILAPPGNPPPPSQRYIIENVKREDLEIYENPPRNSGSGIYINPYNTPPPTGDACCKDVAPLSASSSPYTTGSATPNYRVESPQFYPTKYGKLTMGAEPPNKHSIIQQNTPPPSRAPSQRGHQQPPYYYEGNPHSAPSPAAATAASPSPSSLLTSTTTMSQTQMFHTEYATAQQGSGTAGPNTQQTMLMNQAYPAQPSAQHQATTDALRNSELIVSAQTRNPYERVVPPPPHPHTQQMPPQQQQQHLAKHPGHQQSGPVQMRPVDSAAMGGVHHASKISAGNVATTTPKHHKPNYRELINRTLAIRSATSEEELNMQIIKKTLNVDSPAGRVPHAPIAQSARMGAALEPQPLSSSSERLPLTGRGESLRPELLPTQTAPITKTALSTGSSVLVTLPRHEASRVCIKQEDDKPSSSSSKPAQITTSSSPLDLSMRTVKTKADSTEYKYHHQQQQQQQRRSTPNSSSNEGRYTLPRVDSTPVFSVHAFEPAVNDVAAAGPVRHNSRHNSLDRRNYTPPTQMSASAAMGPNSYQTQTSPAFVTSAANQNNYPPPPPQRRQDVPHSVVGGVSSNIPTPPPHIKNCYETSCVIKTAPKSAALAKNAMTQARPSVLETNPYASVIKTEPKRIVEPITAAASSSTQHALAAVERLPPDTSIMALPPKHHTVYPSQKTVTETPPPPLPPPSSLPVARSSESVMMTPIYQQGCEKNPNFRKRHIQKYSNQMLQGEPAIKQSRMLESSPVITTKPPPIAMRPADISVIAVNESNIQEIERLNKAKQSLEVLIPQSSSGSSSVIAGPQAAKVIVNNHNHQSPSSSSSSSLASTTVVVCKQEPLTPTGDVPTKTEPTAAPPVQLTAQPPPPTPPSTTMHMASSRIRTKAELKGFTFNPPPPMQTQQQPSETKFPTPPPPPMAIKQEEEVQTVKIKEELPETCVNVTAIEGLEDDFAEDKLLDFGWSSTCNNFVEQLLTCPAKKKPLPVAQETNVIKETCGGLIVTAAEKKSLENNIATDCSALKKHVENNFSNMESADNTRSSFNRLEGLESGMTVKSSMNQDSRNSPTSSLPPKKLTKLEREKKRFQQEKRLAERLLAKGSSSESEDELDKRKTERLKKPLMKAKNKLKNLKDSSNENSSSTTQMADKNQRFSDCGYDSSSATEAATTRSLPNLKKERMHEKLAKTAVVNDLPAKDKENATNKNAAISKEAGKMSAAKEQEAVKLKNLSNDENTVRATNKKVTPAKEHDTGKAKANETTSSSSSESEEDDDDDDDDEEELNEKSPKDAKYTKAANGGADKKLVNHSSKSMFKVGLNTMTRSKLKKELELQLANSKVLRNDKIIRNSSTTKLRRKYVRKYVNNVNSFLESGGLSRESGIMKSTRLKAKLERKGGNALALLKKDNKANKCVSSSIKGADAAAKAGKNENEHDPNVLELYRFKRALKVPPSLINIKQTGSHKTAASLPDLERHAEALDAYAKKKKKSKFLLKGKNDKTSANKSLAKSKNVEHVDDMEGPRSIIDVLHSRVTKSSGLNVRNKTTTTTATSAAAAPKLTANKTCASSTTKSYAAGNNCGMFSETSQTTESSELQMLPPLKQDSADEEDEDDNESANGAAGKKRHFSIFDTTVLPTKTRTESKMQQKRENIREIFVGDDRPASAPPEMIQAPDNVGEKMTYEQKYEQFLQQMNIVISADKFGRFGRSAAARKLMTPSEHQSSALSIKQEEVDTESTSVMDPDEPAEDLKCELNVNQLRKKRGKYLRRKGSSGFDYIRKKKKPTSSTTTPAGGNTNATTNNNCNHFAIKAEKMEADEYEYKMKTEDDVSREIQKWVLNKGVGQSTMHKAARQGYIDVIVYCLDRLGMNPDQKDNAGYTPLHEACTNGWLDIARILLQYGANHSAAAHSGIRPLHEASENDNEEIVRLLLAYGADPLLATYSGQTPLMLASSTTMRDILSNHLIDVQTMLGPERKPWKFNGPWAIYDPKECGFNVFEGAPNSLCDMSRALLRKGSLTNNQMYQNKKLQNVLTNNNNTTTITTTNTTINNSNINQITTATTTTTMANSAAANTAFHQNSQNGPTNNNSGSSCSSSSSSTSSGVSSSVTINSAAYNSGAIGAKGLENLTTSQQQQQLHLKCGGETTTKTVMDKCAVVLDKIDRFNAVRLNNDSKQEILVENSDSDGEMFEFEEADILLPPLYLLKDEGTNDKWVLLSDLCNLLKVKSKDTLLNKIYPSSSSSVATATAHKSLMRELKMSDFLEKATCLQLLCAGEKLNICASKVVLIKYNENVRNLLGVKTILMKF